jgi:hypothetical protein
LWLWWAGYGSVNHRNSLMVLCLFESLKQLKSFSLTSAHFTDLPVWPYSVDAILWFLGGYCFSKLNGILPPFSKHRFVYIFALPFIAWFPVSLV